MKIVCISGGFDPIHSGHIRLIQDAADYGDLLVILNNDNWLTQKKGFVFMTENERKEILHAIKGVKYVYTTFHRPNPTDMSICAELVAYRPDIFCNGGDRTEENTPEKELCKTLGIEIVYNIGGGKVQSSSELVDKAKGRARTVWECKNG